jgi:hypothetical protein
MLELAGDIEAVTITGFPMFRELSRDIEDIK